jgi:hypothetical protein
MAAHSLESVGMATEPPKGKIGWALIHSWSIAAPRLVIAGQPQFHFCVSMRFDDKPDLHVEVQGDYVIITLPGTKYRVTYYKLDDRPELRAKSDWTDDPNAPVTLGAFRARAWIAANDKARELGWIV